MRILVGIILYFLSTQTVTVENRNFAISEESTEQDSGGRIIGGTPARPGQFPFAAAIKVTTPTGSSFCGGALISTQWVITAGHCLVNATWFEISLGSLYLPESEDFDGVLVSTSTYYIHPEFNESILFNDIGLIKFREQIEFNDYTGKIYLPIAKYLENVNVSAIGWGQTSNGQEGLDEHLNFVDLITLHNDECKIYFGPQITEEMICVVGQWDEGICIGDAGGPLVYLLDNKHPVVVGVGSFYSGFGCESAEPSGYTRVYPYREWILSITGDLFT